MPRGLPEVKVQSIPIEHIRDISNNPTQLHDEEIYTHFQFGFIFSQ